MAKKTTIGAGITLDGEKQFKQALAEINNGLKVTTSELMLVTARFSDNANSMEALTAKSTVLENSVNSQREKITKLQEALAHSATTYGEADSKTMKWQVSLNKAEAELIDMEKDLQKTQDELKDFGKETEEATKQTNTLGNKVNDLAGKLGINLPAGAQEAIKALDGQKVSTLALLGATTALITGLARTTIETAKLADEIITLSKVTGLSTDAIQQMNYASELVDVSTETMAGAMRKMIKSMDDARGGGKAASEAFKELHLNITNNGKLKDSEQMFYELIDALGRVKNETERDALAMQIFGKSAQELNPLIDAGSSALKEFGEQAQAMGYVMGPETLEKFGRLDDAMQKLSNQSVALKNSVAIALLPVFTGFFELLNKMDPKLIASIAIIGTMAAVAISVVKAIKSVTDIFKPVTEATKAASVATEMANTKWIKTVAIVVGVVAALIALAAIIAVIIGRGDELNRTINSVGGSVGNMVGTVNNAGNQIQIGRNAAGTNNWRGGLTWVHEEGGEIMDLPRGTRIIPHDVSMEMARSGGNSRGEVYNFQPGSIIIDAKNVKEFNDVVRMVKGAKQTKNAGMVMA